MLTADLVTPLVRGPVLLVRPLSKKKRARALEMAAHIVQVGQDSLGQRRHRVQAALDAFDFASRELKLFRGLLKLYDDACRWAPEADVDGPAFRAAVFALAHQRRQAAARRHPGLADEVLREVGAAHGLDDEVARAALYADLKENWRLDHAPALSPDELVQRYDDGQVQGVLLRAEQVVVELEPRSPAAVRGLLKALKFRELLFVAERNDDGSWRLTIDGPMSLFRSQTLYGLRLALAYPALCRAGSFFLRAEVRWGKGRRRKSLEVEHRQARDESEAALDEPATTLVDGLVEAGLSAVISDDLVQTPEGMVLVPDVRVTGPAGEVVFIEQLGFWSRQAVVRRVEGVEAGLAEKMLFLVPKKLRVSEKMLADDADSGLLVFSGAPDPGRVAKRVLAMFSEG